MNSEYEDHEARQVIKNTIVGQILKLITEANTYDAQYNIINLIIRYKQFTVINHTYSYKIPRHAQLHKPNHIKFKRKPQPNSKLTALFTTLFKSKLSHSTPTQFIDKDNITFVSIQNDDILVEISNSDIIDILNMTILRDCLLVTIFIIQYYNGSIPNIYNYLYGTTTTNGFIQMCIRGKNISALKWLAHNSAASEVTSLNNIIDTLSTT